MGDQAPREMTVRDFTVSTEPGVQAGPSDILFSCRYEPRFPSGCLGSRVHVICASTRTTAKPSAYGGRKRAAATPCAGGAVPMANRCANSGRRVHIR